MKNRFLTTLVVSIAFTFAMAWMMYAIITNGLGNTLRDDQGKLNYVVKDTTHYNVVFMGSSRVFTHIDPILFDSITGFNSYNAGIDGIRVAEMEAILSKYFKCHGIPRYTIINLDATTLRNEFIWDYSRFFPYMSDSTFVVLSKYQTEMLLAKYLPPVALTYYDDPKKSLGLQGLFTKGELKYKDSKGFHALDAVESKIEPMNPTGFYSDADGISAFKRILDLCLANGTKPIIIIAPLYVSKSADRTTNDEYLKALKGMSQMQNVPIWDFTSDTTFMSKSMFRDQSHLNVIGAHLYTTYLADSFKIMVSNIDTLANNSR